MNHWASNVKRGYTFDPEDARTTHRYRLARGILENSGVVPEIPDHQQGCTPEVRRNSLSGTCSCDLTPVWEPWVTDPMFELAWNLACEIQTKRGNFNRAAASRAKAGTR